MVGLIYILCTAVCLFICSRTWGISGTFQVLTDNFCSKDFTNQRGQRKVNGREFSTEKQNEIHRMQGPWEECKCVAEVQVRWGGGYLQWSPGKKQALGVSGKKRDPCALLLHCKSVCGQFRAPNSWSLSWSLSPVFVIMWCGGFVSGAALSCSVQRSAVKMGKQGNEAHEVCAIWGLAWPGRSRVGVLHKHSLGHEVSSSPVQFFAVIKALSMPVMQNRKHKENVFSSAIILACLCVYESFLLHLEGWDAELFSKEVSKVHPHSSQQLAWQKGYSKWLALFPSILPLET